MPFIDTFPEPTPVLRTGSLLNFILDLLPANYGALQREIWEPRLKVDGTEVGIRESVRVSESEGSVGESITLTLLDDADRTLFTNSAVIEFGIGRQIAGVWDETTFEVLLAGAKVSQIGYNIQGAPEAMNDRVSITLISGSVNSLNKTSEKGLIIYDSNRVTINNSDLKSVKDSSGNVFLPDVIAVPGLKLSDLFQEVFVTKCGFNSYKTNIPADDYPIERYQVKMGGRFYDGLKGFIGMFGVKGPAISIIDDDVWIMDTTAPQPAGFPDPKEITIDRPLSINTQTSREQLDGLLVQYVGLTNNYDFTTFRFDYTTESRGNVVTNIETITVEFRKAGPITSTVVREVKNSENRRSFVGGVEVDSTSEVTEFTPNGWPAHIRKTTQKLLPLTSNLTGPLVLQNVLTEKEECVYLPHPFKPQTQYLARRSFKSEGLIAVDTVFLTVSGAAYKQSFAEAYRAGNIIESHTFIFGDIKGREESFEPLRSGQVRTRLYEIDKINKIVTVDRLAEKAGEVGLPGVASSQEELLVLAPGVTLRTSDFIDNFAGGELPLRYLEPLAQRVIVQRQAGAGTVGIPVIAYDKTLRKGIPIKVGDRDGNFLGNFLIVGREIDIDASGVIMNLTGRAIPGSTEALQQIPVYARSANSGEVLTFTIPIICTTGYTLRVLQGSVTNVAIEARHGVAGAFTNIETTELDLSPWDGSTENFQVRITVGTISAVTRIQFDLNVDLAI